MPFFSRNSNSRSNLAQCGAGSQHLIQPQSTYKRFKTSVARLFYSLRHHNLAPTQVLAVDITALGIRQGVPVGHEQHASDIANGIPHRPRTPTPRHDPLAPVSMQTEGRNPLPSIAEPITVPVATQFQGAHSFNISGHPRFVNIGTVHNYGGMHGLENLKEFVSFAALHDSSEQDPTRRCHPGTRTNVLNQLRNWFDNPNATECICWLHGPAGAGKSAIAQTIAHEYKKRGVAATFFFFRSDADRNNGNRLFPTLAWQLAFSIPAIKSFIVHALNNAPHIPTKDVETQFEQLVAYPFEPTNYIASQLPRSAPVVIIDGVDECFDERLQRRILSIIGNAVKDDLVPLHFLICSRPEALIEEVLDQFKDFTLCIDLAALDDSNRDIEKYLIDQFSVIASKRGLDPTWPGPEIIEEFVFKSSGNFIFAATAMRCVSDEDCDPEEQLDIVRNLKPCGKMSPFALLDELYLEILKQQRDQDFVKTFLALLVTRSSIDTHYLPEDDAWLMSVSQKNLHMKLRRMRSLLKFGPSIDVYHKSFLDFLQDSSRSGEYHVSKQGGQKRYLGLIVDCVVRHVSVAVGQPNNHKKCRSSPQFRSIVIDYPPKIVLPIEDWQEALKPLLCLQDRLINTLQLPPCRVTQVMRELLLHMAILQRKPIAAQAQESNMTEWNPALVTRTRNLPENDLDRRLSELLSCLQKTNSALAVDTVIIERLSSLIAFDYVETVSQIQSVTDAQKLIDLIDLLINNETFVNQYGWSATRKAARLASEIYSRVPLLPRSVFMNGPTQPFDWVFKTKSGSLQYLCQSMLISRILHHNYIVPAWCIYQGGEIKFVDGNANEQNESLCAWQNRSMPNFVTRIRVMLEVAKSIRGIHSMGVVALHSDAITSAHIALDSNLHAKVHCYGAFTWQVRENLIFEEDIMGQFTPEHNVSKFASLFQVVCFDDPNENYPGHLVEGARRLIERCLFVVPQSRPSMWDVVKEMETWDLT